MDVTTWGEFLKSVKFLVEEPLADGSYLRSDLSICQATEKRLSTDSSKSNRVHNRTSWPPRRAVDVSLNYQSFWDRTMDGNCPSEWISSALSKWKTQLMNSRFISTDAKLRFVPKIPVRLFKRFTAGCLDIGLYAHWCSKLPMALKCLLYDWALPEHLMLSVGRFRNSSVCSQKKHLFFHLACEGNFGWADSWTGKKK